MNSRHFCWVNSMKDRKKPAIRFKGFTEDWEQRKLGEVLRTLPFKPFLKIPDQDGKYEIIQQGNEPIIGYANGEPCEDFRNIVIFGDHTLSLYKPKQPFFVATDGVRILQGTNDMDGYYLLSLLEGNSPKSEGYKRYYSILVDREVLFTENYYEQVKIGLYFKQLDNLITLHQRKYDKLVNVKKSMLEKMFPCDGKIVPDIRFSGFTEDWEQRKLGEMVSFSKGSGYSKGDLKENGTPIILYGRLYTKYETIISEVDTFADYKKGSVYSKGGEVIVPASGETAEDISIASVVEKSNILLGGDLNVITPQDYLDSPFLAISISNGKPHNDMAKMAQGKSVVHLHNSDLEKIELPYPYIAEQRKISRFFSNLDKLITLHQRKLEKLKNIKKSCLEKMFI